MVNYIVITVISKPFYLQKEINIKQNNSS